LRFDIERIKYNHYSATQILRFLGLVKNGKQVDELIKQGELESENSWEVTGDSLRSYIQKKLQEKQKAER
jgi:hypothetical protein